MPVLRRLDLRGGSTRGIGRPPNCDLGAGSVTAAKSTVQGRPSALRRSISLRVAVVAVVGALAVGAAGAAPIIVSTTQTEVTIGGLSCGTRYRVRVNVAGSSPVTTLNPVTKPCTAPQPPPPPPPPGVLFDQLSDFPVFFNIHGASEISTPSGPGFRFVVPASMHPPWDVTSKASMGKWSYPADFLGKTYTWTLDVMLPSAGNPNGLPETWHAGTLFQDHTSSQSGHHLALDSVMFPTNRFRYGVWIGPGNNYEYQWSEQAIQYDRWYRFKWEIKYSTGADGYVKMWMDGVQVVNHAGPSIEPGSGLAMQVGYYSAAQLTNEVRYGGVQYRRTG
jgi:hypothetical protein